MVPWSFEFRYSVCFNFFFSCIGDVSLSFMLHLFYLSLKKIFSVLGFKINSNINVYYNVSFLYLVFMCFYVGFIK